ncbi:MAG: amidohydrolase [Candidatus Methanofastidiosia archaeon]
MYTDGKFVRRDIDVTNGIISSLGKEMSGGDVFDARNFILLPGFVNTHTHLAMTLFRGTGDDMPLHKWLEERIWPLEANLTTKDCYWGNMLGIVEMIRTGTTCFNDMYFHMDTAVQAIKESGMRACITQGMLDLGNKTKANTEMRESTRIQSICEEEPNITFMMGPHAPYTCSKEFLLEIKRYAQEHALRIHIHLAETQKEVQDIKKERGMTPVEYLESLSFLDENVVLAHCVHLTDSDISIMAKYGVSVAHCPNSNLKLSSGIAPVNNMVSAGINVSLGTDGASSNNSINMQQEMKSMALIHKLNDPTHIDAKTAFSIATKCGGQALGLNIGELSPGYAADILFINPLHYSMIPSNNIISNIVYSMNTEAISHVMINGKFVMLDGKIINLNEEKIYKKASEHAQKLVEKLE